MKGHESKMKGNEWNMKGNECKMKGTWDEMNATWKAMKGDENNRWHPLTLDQGCFHTLRKLENSHFLSTGSSPPQKTIRGKMRQRDLGYLKRYGEFIQSHMINSSRGNLSLNSIDLNCFLIWPICSIHSRFAVWVGVEKDDAVYISIPYHWYIFVGRLKQPHCDLTGIWWLIGESSQNSLNPALQFTTIYPCITM